MIAESIISISLLAAGAQLTRNTKDAYQIQQSQKEMVVTPPPSMVLWNATTALPYGYPTNSSTPLFTDSDIAVARAFSASGIRIEDGLIFIGKAKEILNDAQYPCVDLIPTLALDLDEGVTYLTLKLRVKATFEKSLELDSILTRGLVNSFKRLPERLSFAVYETGADVV